jgi:hypothetical protein
MKGERRQSVPQFLFRVADTFDIRGRGVVVAADRTYQTLDIDMRLLIGDPIEFRSDERNPIRTTVAGIEFLNPWSPTRPFVFLLPREIEKDQIAIGSEVWQLNKH